MLTFFLFGLVSTIFDAMSEVKNDKISKILNIETTIRGNV